MNKLSQVMVILLIISIPGAAVARKIIPPQLSQITQKQNSPRTAESIPVSLSESVNVFLKQGGLNSGDFVNFNSGGITLAVGGSFKMVPVAQIKKVEFEGDVWIPDGNGYRKLRGGDRTTNGQKTWSGIPLTAFNLQQNAKIALLRLRGILSNEDWQDLRSQSKDLIYVLDEMEFEASGNRMTVKATPVDR